MMPSLTIGWEYLTGAAVATDPSDRTRAEWPPHPARVFMALAAAWFETVEEPDEGAALRWLEGLGEPELHLPPYDHEFERSPVTVFVPVNDKADAHHQPDKKKPATLFQKLGDVAIGRNRQARTFPCVWVGFDPCFLHWPDAPGIHNHRDALARLCQKVTRIGHSSSMVRMWVAENDYSACENSECWVPDDLLAQVRARRTSDGMLDMLIELYGQELRERRARLTDQIGTLKEEKKAVKGKQFRQRRAEIDARLAELTAQRDSIVDRLPVRPSIGLRSGYRRNGDVRADTAIARSHFDTDVLVLKHTAGPHLPLASTLAVTKALRDTIMKHSGEQPVPPWVSGHDPSGEPLRHDDGHLAIIPLPFVGHRNADGHLLGLGMVFPRAVDRQERARVLSNLLVDDEAQPRNVQLTLGRLGLWTLEMRHWSEKTSALQPETWTDDPTGSDTWASVTPVVLDRFPKQDRVHNRAGWVAEVAEIVAEACSRIGIPRPVGVDIDTTSWHMGAPRARAKHRRVRGPLRAGTKPETPVGDGFPPYPAKGVNAPRPQVHLWVRFDEPVLGPILLGAGRYRGYGLLKPWKGGQR